VSKDIKAGDIHVKELTDEKKRMIKKFVVDYMDKVIARQEERRAQKEIVPSDSVSTETPQIPESTPREIKDKGVGEDGNKPLSPREILKGLEVLGSEAER
jgi:SRI (Set2 Rpb1 interacting) domain